MYIINKFIMNEISEKRVELNSNNKKKSSGNKCCLPHCGRSKRNVPNLKIFRFPYLDTILLKRWLEKCNFDESVVERSRTLYICERHFTSDCIGKRYLKRSAVPTLNLISIKEEIDINEENCVESEFISLSQPLTRKRSESPLLWTNCHTSCKNESYRKKYFNILKKLRTVAEEKYYLKSENKRLKRRIKTLKNDVKNTKSVAAKIDELNINPNEKTFCKMLTKVERGTNARWKDHEIIFAQSIFHRSTANYMFLRNKLKLNLPSPSSLSRWNSSKNLQPDSLYTYSEGRTSTCSPI